jgi:GGDEF domain-containing protein
MYQSSIQASQEASVGVDNQRASSTRRPPAIAEADPLYALEALDRCGAAEPEDLFRTGLDLLVRQLGVDRALVASQDGRSLEYLWSATGPVPPRDAAAGPELDPGLNFCGQVLGGAGATLVIADAARDPRWAQHPALVRLGIRAYIGAPLRRSGQVAGVLSVHSRTARTWETGEVALVNVLAGVFGQALEVACLKAELSQAQAILDLTSAVVEDQALDNPRTGLPSRRYLEVWCRSNLVQARRRREVLALAVWAQPPQPGRDGALRRLAGSLRGGDLLADLGQDRFLLVLPRTTRTGAEVVLGRLRQALGPVPVGATLWNPLVRPDRDAPNLEPAIRRAQAALVRGVEPVGPEADDGCVAWSVLEPSQASFREEAGEW